MPILHTSLSVVITKFPDHTAKIKRLFRENPNFYAQCEDYLRCSKALKFWERSGTQNGLARRDEYESILKDLESEILQSLNEYE